MRWKASGVATSSMAVPLPKSVGIAEGRHAALGRDAGASQHGDSLSGPQNAGGSVEIRGGNHQLGLFLKLASPIRYGFDGSTPRGRFMTATERLEARAAISRRTGPAASAHLRRRPEPLAISRRRISRSRRMGAHGDRAARTGCGSISARLGLRSRHGRRCVRAARRAGNGVRHRPRLRQRSAPAGRRQSGDGKLPRSRRSSIAVRGRLL